MGHVRRCTCLLLLIVSAMFAPAMSEAQQFKRSIQPFAEGAVAYTHNLGYSNPDYIAGAGLEYSSPDLLIVGKGDFFSADKLQLRNGSQVTARVSAFLRIDKALVGGGVKRDWLYTSRFEKSALKPFVGAGFENERWRLLGDFVFAGSDTANRAQDIEGEVQLKLSQHFRLRGAAESVRYSPNSFLKTKNWGSEVSAGVVFLL